MYKLIFAVFGVLMFVIGTNAHAFGDTNNSSRASSSSRSTAMAGASAHQAQAAIAGASQQGNTTNVSDSSVYEDTKQHKNAPSVVAPGLVAGATTCLGSTSAGGSIAGFGISGGSTTADPSCVAINGSIRFAQLGLNNAAVRVLCSVEVYRKTLEETGYSCEDGKAPDAPVTVFTSNASVGSGFMQ